MKNNLKDLAIELYVLFFLKEKNMPYQDKKKIAKQRAIEYAEERIIRDRDSVKRYSHIQDDEWESVKKFLQLL